MTTTMVAVDETTPLLSEKATTQDGGRDTDSGEMCAVMPLQRYVLIVVALAGISNISSMATGLLTVSLPKMAVELGISDEMLLWPGSIYGLSCGCFLLVAGSLADVIGARIVYLSGCALLTLFALATGLASSPTQSLVCLAAQGAGVALCLPTTLSLLHAYSSSDRRRNMALAVIGANSSLGYSFGIFGGGRFVDSLGWRCGWFMEFVCAAMILVLSLLSLPRFSASESHETILERLAKEIDWVGAAIASGGLGCLAFTLLRTASLSSIGKNILDIWNICGLCICALCIPMFVAWMARRGRNKQPALIPNYFWANRAFSSICTMTFLSWAVSHVMESLLSLFFQKIQHLSATETSLRFAPNVVTGVIMNIVSGLIVHKISSYWIALIVCTLAAMSPLLMIRATAQSSYWGTSFGALLTSSASCDGLFLVSALVISNAFPREAQARASAVLNTMGQFGTAVGLAVASTVSSAVTESRQAQHRSRGEDLTPTAEDLLAGFRANYWLCLGLAFLAIALSVWGLERKTRDATQEARETLRVTKHLTSCCAQPCTDPTCNCTCMLCV